MNWVVGIDLGGTKTAIGLINPQDQIVERVRLPTLAEEGPSSIVARIGDVVDGFRTRIPADEALTGLGMCAPGPIDPINGIIVNPTNLPKFYNTPMSQLLGDRLSIPVKLEHDAKAAALGEFYFGAGRGEQSMIYIIVGTGVGAALIIDGVIYRGMHNSAGEFGHTVLERNGLLCSCGNHGCVETFMSGPRLVQWYEIMQHGGPVVGGELSFPSTGEEVAKLAVQGDPSAVAVLTQAGAALGAAIATLAMIVNIDLYVVGGSVAKCGDLLLAPARQAAPRHAFASVASHIRIVASTLDTDAPILGCAWLARQQVR